MHTIAATREATAAPREIVADNLALARQLLRQELTALGTVWPSAPGANHDLADPARVLDLFATSSEYPALDDHSADALERLAAEVATLAAAVQTTHGRTYVIGAGYRDAGHRDDLCAVVSLAIINLAEHI